MSKLLVDISHLMNSSGRMSGIERVEYNIVSHYIHSDAEFVGWSLVGKCFVEFSKQDVEVLLASIEQKQQAVKVEKGEISNKTQFLSRIKAKALRPKNNSPQAYVFKNNERLLILDGLWDRQDYIDAVVNAGKILQIDHIVYDMIPVIFPGYVLDFITVVFENYMKTILPICTNIYTISENTAVDTKQVLVDWGVQKIPSIASFQLGDDILSSTTTDDSLVPEESYILATGTVEVRKNYSLLLYAYGIAREKSIDLPPTYIVGKRGWLTDNFQYIVDNDPYYKAKIKILDNVSDAQLASLYESSLFTVCTSLYEGWGLPIRESLAYGKVTLSSNTSSLPEAGGLVAEYFSPNNPEALLNMIVKYLDKDSRKKRENYIAKKYKQLSWEKAMNRFASIVDWQD